MSEVNEESVSENQLDRKDLKIMAYQQSLSEKEEKIVEMRVDLTFAASQIQELQARLDEHDQPSVEAPKEVDVPKNSTAPDA